MGTHLASNALMHPRGAAWSGWESACGPQAVIRVAGTGPGISADELRRVSGWFFTVCLPAQAAQPGNRFLTGPSRPLPTVRA